MTKNQKKNMTIANHFLTGQLTTNVQQIYGQSSVTPYLKFQVNNFSF